MSPAKKSEVTPAQQEILETNFLEKALYYLNSAASLFKAQIGNLPYMWCIRELRDNIPMKQCPYRGGNILACGRCQHIIYPGDLLRDEEKRALLPGLVARIDEELNRCVQYDKRRREEYASQE